MIYIDAEDFVVVVKLISFCRSCW